MAAKPPSMSRAVAASLRDAQTLPRDVGAVALVKRYAALIDGAAEIAEQLDVVQEDLDPEDVSAYKQLHALRAKVDAHVVASDLGPKLLAALTALGMTVQGRAAGTGKGGDQGGKQSGPADALARLRAARAGASS